MRLWGFTKLKGPRFGVQERAAFWGTRGETGKRKGGDAPQQRGDLSKKGETLPSLRSTRKKKGRSKGRGLRNFLRVRGGWHLHGTQGVEGWSAGTRHGFTKRENDPDSVSKEGFQKNQRKRVIAVTHRQGESRRTKRDRFPEAWAPKKCRDRRNTTHRKASEQVRQPA